LSPQRFFDAIQNYSEEDIINLITDIDKILDLEQNLIYIPQGKTMVVGDLHGDLETLKKIIQVFFRDNFKNLIFLGDYVDRGVKQVEVINVLFYYKKLLPKKIILLRGNHEDPIINRQYGFYDEIRIKFDKSKEIFRMYNQAFSKLPLAALTWNRIFCVHAGIPEHLDEIEDINNLPKNQEEITCPITTQLVWNDPKERKKDFGRSSRGPGIKTFGREALDEFVERNQLNLIIRAHEKIKNGYKKYFNEKLLSIFTSQSYSKKILTVVGVIDSAGSVDVIPI
jgi:diadenosine tetraphosphatase ApaH/serine/threonine PP2A family protein phosphatase